MKKIIFFVLIIFLMWPSGLLAFEVSLTPLANKEFFYAKTFDNVVLDFFVLPEKTDFLRAVTIKNLGDAKQDKEIKELTLYADRGSNYFEGYGLDKVLARAKYLGNDQWYFDGFDEEISTTGKRFYVTVETSNQGTDDRTFQFMIPQYFNNDQLFNPGDRGIFLTSKTPAPTEDLQVKTFAKYKKLTEDILPAVAVITNLFDGDQISTTEFNIYGKAKDQGGSQVEYVYVCIDNRCSRPQNTGYAYSDWVYFWKNIQVGEHEIYLKIKDYGSGLVAQTPKIKVRAIEPYSYDESKTEFSVNKIKVVADGFDFGLLTVALYDIRGFALPGQTIEILSDSSTVLYDKRSAVSNAQGKAIFVVKSLVRQQATFWPKINGQEIEAINVDFVDKSQTGIDFDEENNYNEINYYRGRWLKTINSSAVYFLDENNIRHAYPTQEIWQSYFGDDFSRVQIISEQQMSSYDLGVNVPFAVGSLIKLATVPKVYLVGQGRVLSWIENEGTAQKLFADDWVARVKILPDSLLGDYTVSQTISL